MVGFLPYLNLQWTRRYFESGEFSAQIRMEDYDPDVAYLYTTDRPEMGVVEKCRSQSEITGKFVQLSGRFLEGMLSRNIVWPALKTSGRPGTLARQLVQKYAADIPKLTFAAFAEDRSEEETDVEFLGEQLDEATWPLLESAEKSQRIAYDFAGERFVYSVWQGKDRTQSQNVNNFALFSDVNQDTETITIDEDESGYRNFALIGLPDGKSLTVDKRRSGDEARRFLWIDETSGGPEEGQTEKQWHSALKWSANGELLKWPRINNVEAKTIQSGLLYLADYDLGDKCDIVSNEMKKSYESRIIEVREVFKEGQHEVEIVFGEKIPTIYERMMNK